MSHFTVMIIGKDVDGQLAPFQENNMGDCPKQYMEFSPIEIGPDQTYKTISEALDDGYEEENGQVGYWYNPNCKWDWWVIGGRWTGFLKLKEGATGQVGEPGVFGNKAENGRVDQALKKDIDVDGMRNEQEQKARESWKKVNDCIGGRDFVSWDDAQKKFPDDIDKARDLYNGQQVIKDFRALDMGFFAKIDDYLGSEEDFAQSARNLALSTFAVLKDGEWIEKGEMGWWGMVSNESEDWATQFNKAFDEIDDNELITIVDCHI